MITAKAEAASLLQRRKDYAVVLAVIHGKRLLGGLEDRFK